MTATHLADIRAALTTAAVQVFVPCGTAELYNTTDELAEIIRAVRGASRQVQRGIANLPDARQGLHSDSGAINPDTARRTALSELDAAANSLQVAEVAVNRAHEAISHLYSAGLVRQ